MESRANGTASASARSGALERRTWGALALGAACLAALSLVYLLATPAPGMFLLVIFGLYGVVARTVIRKVADFHPHARFGYANTATLLRGTIACLFFGLALDWHDISGSLDGLAAWWVPALALAAIALDGLDGWMARRQGLSSRFGARFDMEMDALLILAMAALAVALDKAGFWLLLIGAMRYLFVGAGLLYAPLARRLPESVRRKTVCVIQVGVLTMILTPMVSGIWAIAIGLAALVTLLWSFGLDVVWLYQKRHLPS